MIPARDRYKTLTRDLNGYIRSTNDTGKKHKKEMKK